MKRWGAVLAAAIILVLAVWFLLARRGGSSAEALRDVHDDLVNQKIDFAGRDRTSADREE